MEHSGDDGVMMLQARGPWRCVMPARRSEQVVACSRRGE